jgi:APA family basic amino acid/polyamine antiporter
MSLFTRKNIQELQAQASATGEGTLKRSLSATNLTMIGIGGIIGAGIFVLTGHAAATYAGPAVVLSFVISAITCALAGLCYSEMASAVPVSGSAYTYAYATLGELMAWIIGWDLVLEYGVGAVTVAVGWAGYLKGFLEGFGIHVAQAYSSAPFDWIQDKATHAHHFVSTGAVVNLPAMLIVALVTALLVIGIETSARVNAAFVVLKVSIIVLFIALGLGHVLHSNWVTVGNPEGLFIPPQTGPGQFGWEGIIRASGVVFFAYIGFDAVSTAAQESKNPQRDMPIGMLGSLAICTVLYILVAYVLTGVVPYDQLNVAQPIAKGIDAMGLPWLAPFIKLGAILGLSSVILVLMLGQTRVFFAMSKDGLLPVKFGQVHAKFRTPARITLVTGMAIMVAAGLAPIGLVGELCSIGTLFAFAIVCLGVMALRILDPKLHRPFRTPWIWLIGPAGAGASFWLMCALPLDTWIRLGVWMGIGLVYYFVYGKRNAARVRAENEGLHLNLPSR